MDKIKKFISIIILIIILPILFVNVVILVDSVVHPNEVPGFFGYKPFIVLSGSMKKEINSGDLVLTKEIDPTTLKKGDIISFREGEIVVTHRIVDIVEKDGEKGFVTKGDNNEANDLNIVKFENVEGIYLNKISGLGNVAMFIQTPTGIIISLSIPLAILICMNLMQANSNKNDEETERMKQEIEKLKQENAQLKK
ncbi:MAG: signal peptidase I [Clostridia bacterium]|nr:signal peptidase I [Clostridia bacterium]